MSNLLETLGFIINYDKLQNHTSTADPVPWVLSKVHLNRAAPSTREGLDHHSELPLANETANHYNPPTILITGKDDSSTSSSLISPNTIPSPSILEDMVT